MKKLFLLLSTIFILTSCENISGGFEFPEKDNYINFKKNWVEPENYSFVLRFDNHSHGYHNPHYDVKIVKENSEIKFFIEDEDIIFDDYSIEISKEEFLQKVGKTNYIESISDCLNHFDYYIDYYLSIGTNYRHVANFKYQLSGDEKNDYFDFDIDSYNTSSFGGVARSFSMKISYIKIW